MSSDFFDLPPESLEFARLLREHQDELIDRAARYIIGMAKGTYAHVPFEEIRPRTAVGFEALQRSFAEDPSSYATFWGKLARERVRQGYTIKDTQDAISAVRHVLSEFIAESYAGDPETMLTVTRLAEDIQDGARMALSVVYITALEGAVAERKQAEEALQRAHDELERRVEERAAELSKANAILKEQVAERKRVEEALTYERDLLHTLMDNMPDFIFFKDAQSRFIRTNRAHAQAMGLADPQEAVGKTDFDLFPQRDAQRFYDEEQRIMQSRQPVIDRVWHIPGRAGEIIWVSESKIPLIDEAGQVVGLAGISRDITERKQVEKRAHLQQEIIETQRRALRELSTPIVPVLEGVLVLPLVGSIDTGRAQQIMETLLNAIGRYQAEVVIIDITGVPVVDTGVANHLVQVTRAAALLGAECVLVGISPEVAQTIVSLGVDLSSIVTQANLQSGIEYALKKIGRRIVKG